MFVSHTKWPYTLAYKYSRVLLYTQVLHIDVLNNTVTVETT